MGTSLTGLTPATTYDALIKVGDNGPLSATAKVLSDGLGNDSKLNLSTASVGIGTSSPPTIFGVEDTNANVAVINVIGTSPNYIFDVRDDGTSVFRVAGNGYVGIGTTSPNATLTVRTSGINSGLELGTEAAGASILSYDRASTTYKKVFIRGSIIEFNPNDINRVTVTADGLTFNGDTAAANALDDYEEGTWTMGVSFGGASVGVTTSANTGTYTKIGRQVTVNGYLELTSKGSSTGSARITGLPFSIPNLTQNYATAGLYFGQITFANQFQGYGVVNTTTIQLDEITILGVITPIENGDFANNSVLMINYTYFV